MIIGAPVTSGFRLLPSSQAACAQSWRGKGPVFQAYSASAGTHSWPALVIYGGSRGFCQLLTRIARLDAETRLPPWTLTNELRSLLHLHLHFAYGHLSFLLSPHISR